MQYIDAGHVILLKVVIEYIDRHGEPPSTLQIFDPQTRSGLYNAFLAENEIGAIVAKPIPGNSFLINMVKELRSVNLLDPGRPHVTPTPQGIMLASTFHPENNRPFYIEVNEYGNFDARKVQLPLR